MDPGSDRSFIHERVIPKGAVPKVIRPKVTRTLSGTTNYTRVVELQGILLPEFSRSKHIDRKFECFVSNHVGTTDVILGNDFLIAVGINCNGADQTITWLDSKVPYKPNNYFNDKQQMYVDFLDSLSPDEEINDEDETNPSQILEAKYDKTDVNEVAQKQTHLTQSQRDDLSNLFKGFGKLFSGKIGLYPHQKLHLDLVENENQYIEDHIQYHMQI